MSETIFNSIVRAPIQPPPPEVNWAEFAKVVESRRSVRVFDGSSIPESTMRECLRMALLAPNSSNLQPWEFYWVRSADKKADLVEACLSQPAAKTAAELVVCVARRGTWKKMQRLMLEEFSRADFQIPKAVLHYYQTLVPFAYTQGPFGLIGLIKKLVANAAGLFRPTPREPTSIHQMNLWAVKSTALACQNLMLALRAADFDSCPMEGFDSARVRKILKLPRDATVVMVVGAGRRRPDGVYGRRVRFESRHFVFEV